MQRGHVITRSPVPHARDVRSSVQLKRSRCRCALVRESPAVGESSCVSTRRVSGKLPYDRCGVFLLITDSLCVTYHCTDQLPAQSPAVFLRTRALRAGECHIITASVRRTEMTHAFQTRTSRFKRRHLKGQFTPTKQRLFLF